MIGDGMLFTARGNRLLPFRIQQLFHFVDDDRQTGLGVTAHVVLARFGWRVRTPDRCRRLADEAEADAGLVATF